MVADVMFADVAVVAEDGSGAAVDFEAADVVAAVVLAVAVVAAERAAVAADLEKEKRVAPIAQRQNNPHADTFFIL